MNNPYIDLPQTAFWKSAVAQLPMLEINSLWRPKINISQSDVVVTYGSCFAQHIGRAMAANGYGWKSFESAPYGMSSETAKTFNFDIFSSRTGNIYTTSLLKQWVDWASGSPSPREVWEKAGRYYDPFRPAVEPNGFASEDEVYETRNKTIARFRQSIEKATIFVFTLGLTESWWNSEAGYEYPTCPGTVAGEFNPAKHRFENQTFSRVMESLMAAMSMIRAIKPSIQFLLTVSPVPLTATNSGQHVLVATSASKAILRAVAGEVADSHSDCDYFPSYEIITAPPFKGSFFEVNQRSVTRDGVKFVMGSFFRSLNPDAPQLVPPEPAKIADVASSTEDVICEEELLGAFAR